MKKLFLLVVLITGVLQGFSQGEIIKANDCYAKKDYQCANDNYMIALEKKSFKEGERYLLEYRIAVGYVSLKQYDKAIDYFKKAITSRPDHMDSYWELGDAYFDTGKYQDAVTNYKKAYPMATDNNDKDNLAWWTAIAYNKQKMYASTIAEYKKIQSRDGKYYKTDGGIGDAFYSLGKYDSAIAYYQKGELYYKPGDTTLRLLKFWLGKSFRQVGKNNEAMEQQDAALALDPKYAGAMWEKGIIYANKKEYPAAIELYKKTLPYYVTDSVDSYSLCDNIAVCYQNMNNYAEAVNWQIKRKAFSGNTYGEDLKIASFQYGKLKQPKEAEKTCKDAINRYMLEPAAKQKLLRSNEYVRLNSIAGKIALERKDTVQALKYFDTALSLSKSNYEANAGAAEIAWARKKEDDYKKYFANIYKSTYDTFLSTKKDIANVYARSAHTEAYINKTSYYSSDLSSALRWDSLQKEAVLLWPLVLTTGTASNLNYNRGACLYNLDQAIKQYAADKSYVSEVYNSKAVMLESKDTTAIRKALLEAIKLYPENIKAWDNLMKYYNSYDAATGTVMAEKLIAILKKQKDNATTAAAYVYKGDFLWRLNKKDDAKKAWQEALVWDGDNATAKERVKM